ncbi:MAG TPA: TIGR00730 family Rossman fold protein [Anaerolineales bacterium]|nr:TIGR00730 family Rossman fold protein [Anaerolineales bacterium]
METICVFCGSSDNVAPEYVRAAEAMGRTIARRGLTMVYGGGGTGLMGAVADGALAEGGRVVGILPRMFDSPVLRHGRLTDLRLVDSMHERKATMVELSQAFVALPGGFGTLEELFEVLTWAQIGLHQRPVGMLNTDDYYAHLLRWMERAAMEGFIYPEHRQLYVWASEPEALLDGLEAYRRPEGLERWMTRTEADR